jgi:hypothetical protein
MRRTLQPLTLAAALLALPLAVQAQQAAPQTTPTVPRPALQQRTTLERRAPIAAPLGVPLHINSPVSPPYCDCAYRNLGGQPMRSAELLDHMAGTGAQ